MSNESPDATPAPADDAATAAIRRARAAAKAKGATRPPTTSTRPRYRDDGEVRSGAGPDARDPQSLGASVQRFIDAQGWDDATAVATLTGRWAEIVGPDIAAHASVESFDPETHVLLIRADSGAWATQLRLLTGQFITRLAAELGPDVVRTLTIVGPAAPSRKGQWRVRGGRPDPDA